LISFQLRIKSPFPKNIMDDSEYFFTEVKCKENTQITHTEETQEQHQVIKLVVHEFTLCTSYM
jgi:hypothetical protein